MWIWSRQERNERLDEGFFSIQRNGFEWFPDEALPKVVADPCSLLLRLNKSLIGFKHDWLILAMFWDKLSFGTDDYDLVECVNIPFHMQLIWMTLLDKSKVIMCITKIRGFIMNTLVGLSVCSVVKMLNDIDNLVNCLRPILGRIADMPRNEGQLK
jgi:hypothetical protein